MKWKGTDKPGGTELRCEQHPGKLKNMADCPAFNCRGTLTKKDDDNMECIDCKRIFTLTLLRKIGTLPNIPLGL